MQKFFTGWGCTMEKWKQLWTSGDCHLHMTMQPLYASSLVQCFWQNIVLIKLLATQAFLWLPPTSFSKGINHYWKEKIIHVRQVSSRERDKAAHDNSKTELCRLFCKEEEIMTYVCEIPKETVQRELRLHCVNAAFLKILYGWILFGQTSRTLFCTA